MNFIYLFEFYLFIQILFIYSNFIYLFEFYLFILILFIFEFHLFSNFIYLFEFYLFSNFIYLFEFYLFIQILFVFEFYLFIYSIRLLLLYQTSSIRPHHKSIFQHSPSVFLGESLLGSTYAIPSLVDSSVVTIQRASPSVPLLEGPVNKPKGDNRRFSNDGEISQEKCCKKKNDFFLSIVLKKNMFKKKTLLRFFFFICISSQEHTSRTIYIATVQVCNSVQISFIIIFKNSFPKSLLMVKKKFLKG